MIGSRLLPSMGRDGMTKAQKAASGKVNKTRASTRAAGAAKGGSLPGEETVATKKKSASGVNTFLVVQRERLLSERAVYLRSASELKAQADSLALEHEPGDVQFDEEGGEGGTSNVDRELDLALSNQALAAVNEIDWALKKIDAGTYGLCEKCGQPILEARLEALPHASLCVACKSGGLSSRR